MVYEKKTESLAEVHISKSTPTETALSNLLLLGGSKEMDVSWEMVMLRLCAPEEHAERHWAENGILLLEKDQFNVLMPHAAVSVSHQILGASKMLLLHFLLPKSHSQTCSPGGGTVNTLVKKKNIVT